MGKVTDIKTKILRNLFLDTKMCFKPGHHTLRGPFKTLAS